MRTRELIVFVDPDHTTNFWWTLRLRESDAAFGYERSSVYLLEIHGCNNAFVNPFPKSYVSWSGCKDYWSTEHRMASGVLIRGAQFSKIGINCHLYSGVGRNIYHFTALSKYIFSWSDLGNFERGL